jgi:hypothetical protein
VSLSGIPPIDYRAVAAADTRCTLPLTAPTGDLGLLGALDEHFNLLGIAERAFQVLEG